MKKCKSGYYYCYTDKKCKPIPRGYHVGGRGLLEPDDDSKKSNGNGNGNSNGNGNGGNGGGNGNGSSGGNGGGNGSGGMSEGSLHKWFKGSKSKDGKGGWVNVVTGGTCASDEPGEGTPKCVSSAKRASMTKAERLSAARRKKKADPNQQQKTGAAKPTYVSTDKPKKKMKEEIQITEADKKGKGSGKKDACYHKVKASAKVWPSAYASGRLVQCRKKGAANYGNKSEEMSNWRSEFIWEKVERDEYGDPIGGPKITDKQKKKNLAKNEPDKQHTTDTSEGMAYGITRGSGKPSGQMAAFGKEKKKENPYSLKNKLKMVIKSIAEKERAKAGVTKEDVIPEAKYEAGASTYGKATIRNKRKFGTPGEMPDILTGKKITKDATRGELIAKRREEHKAKRGIKEGVGIATDGVSAMVKAKKEAELRKKEQDAVAKKMKKEETVTLQDADGNDFVEVIDIISAKKVLSDWRSEFAEGAAWTKKSGKSPSGGLNEKGRKSYERENPGSDLKRPQPEGGSRKKSFCARMGGMKKKLTSSKTANDPDSRINKALRKWKC